MSCRKPKVHIQNLFIYLFFKINPDGHEERFSTDRGRRRRGFDLGIGGFGFGPVAESWEAGCGSGSEAEGLGDDSGAMRRVGGVGTRAEAREKAERARSHARHGSRLHGGRRRSSTITTRSHSILRRIRARDLLPCVVFEIREKVRIVSRN